MEQEKNKNGVIALLVVVIVILLVLVVLFATGTINLKSDTVTNNQQSNNNDQIETNTVNNDSQNSNNQYNFGDQVVLSKLSSVKDYFYPGDEQDFSKWFVLEDSDDYIILISGFSMGKVSSADVDDKNLKDLFSNKYNVDFGDTGYIGALDKNDLEKYFNCNFSTLKCDANIDWLKNTISPYGSTITANIENNKVTIYNISDNTIKNDEIGIALYPLVEKIRILKSNLK